MSGKTEYTQAMADVICEKIADGQSLRDICTADDMPSRSTVFKWLSEQKEFSDQYARAREAQADKLADEILSIADESVNDTYTDDNGNERTDHEVVARSRLRVDARKWLASKMAPKKYGDKVETTLKGDPNAPLQIEKIERVIVDPK
jgi:hypothetical protein